MPIARGLAVILFALLVLAPAARAEERFRSHEEGSRNGQEGFRSHKDALGERFDRAPHRPSPPRVPPPAIGDDELERLRRWNQIAIDASGLDHTPVGPRERRVFGEQLGPGRSSRAIAIVQIAVFDAVNSIAGGYQSYADIPAAPRGTSMNAAIAVAAHDTLVALFPSQRKRLSLLLVQDLVHVWLQDRAVATLNGIKVGNRAAYAILKLRRNDGANHPEPVMYDDYMPGPEPGVWRQDPIGLQPIALGGHWGDVRPFVMQSADQFRVIPPPPMASPEYAAAFNEAKVYGGDGDITPTIRTEDQTHIGIYWAYDGTPSLCAPPRLYNQIATQIAEQMHSDAVELARLLALVNTAMADAGIAVWESKYFYHYWRPVTGIREADPGTGPSDLGDGNDATIADETFMPLGAPASNLAGPNFTPPFPAYPSGHAGFGGALFQTLRRFYGTDEIPFMFVSDEFNGVTRDNTGVTRPLLPRSFMSLSQAEEENGQSRIYLGIHWSFDKTEGIKQGREVADYVFENSFEPAP